MSTEKPQDQHPPRDREFSVTRILAAPRETIWKAWTVPEELTKWFGPPGTTTPLHSISIDLKVGARWHFGMVDDASGTIYPVTIEILEFVVLEKLVFATSTLEEPHFVNPNCVATVTFADLDWHTELTFHASGLTDAEIAINI